MHQPAGRDNDSHGRRHSSREDHSREMIVSSVDVIIQAARLRDGMRRVTRIHVTDVVGLEGEVVILQDFGDPR